MPADRIIDASGAEMVLVPGARVNGELIAPFYIDVLPVSLAALGKPGRGPATMIGPQEAMEHARRRGARLPTFAEWVRAARGRHGQEPAPTFNPFTIQGMCERWEWTSTLAPHAGFYVCGGRYRDRPDELPAAENIAAEDEAAVDVGFRCVRDVPSVKARIASPSNAGPRLERYGDVVVFLPAEDGQGPRPGGANGMWWQRAVDVSGPLPTPVMARISLHVEAINLARAVPELSSFASIDCGEVAAGGAYCVLHRHRPGIALDILVDRLVADGGALPVDVARMILLRFLDGIAGAPRMHCLEDMLHLSWEGIIDVLPMHGFGRSPPGLTKMFRRLSPEHLRGDAMVDPAPSLVYRTATLAYELLDGAPSVQHTAPDAMLRATRRRMNRRDLDRDLVDLLHACLRAAPGDRPSLDEVRAALAVDVDARAYLEGLLAAMLPHERSADLRFWENAEMVDPEWVTPLRLRSLRPPPTLEQAIAAAQNVIVT